MASLSASPRSASSSSSEMTTNDVGADAAFLIGLAVGMVVMARLMTWAVKHARELLRQDEDEPPAPTDR